MKGVRLQNQKTENVVRTVIANIIASF